MTQCFCPLLQTLPILAAPRAPRPPAAAAPRTAAPSPQPQPTRRRPTQAPAPQTCCWFSRRQHRRFSNSSNSSSSRSWSRYSRLRYCVFFVIQVIEYKIRISGDRTLWMISHARNNVLHYFTVLRSTPVQLTHLFESCFTPLYFSSDSSPTKPTQK